MECILEDMRSITFKIITPENKYYDEVVDISEIPFREGKTTRVSVSVSFVDSDRCNITIKDLGFGEFVKSSGKVISKELVLSLIHILNICVKTIRIQNLHWL